MHRHVAVLAVFFSMGLIALPAGLRAQPAPAVGTAPVLKIDHEVGTTRELTLALGDNRLLVLSEQIVRVSVANPAVADLKVVTRTQVLLTAKGVGATDLTLWNKQDVPLVLSLQVTRNLESLRRQMRTLFPGQKITVSAVGEIVVLSGEVTDLRVPERAVEVAKLQADKVANLIQVAGNQQVQLEVKFAEVSRTGLREIGLNFLYKDPAKGRVGGITGPGSSAGATALVPGTGAVGGPPEIFTPNNFNTFSLFFSSSNKFPFSAMLSLLESTGLSKTLAEPTLVALSGQEAKFLAGGEFPVPISSGLGTVSVLWKKFGILLNFTPTVITEGVINLRMASEVSDIDPSASITVSGITIPGLKSRQSETTIRLGDGQSFAVAGLLSDKVRAQVDKLPLLGDIPILGALFRSSSFRRDETELLVVVTARLVRPMAPHEVPPLPTEDELNDPNDFQLFLMGRIGTPRQLHSRFAADGRGPAGEIGFIR
ncbi:MAG TPA: type II and III secretion system protein family protein [Polyangia bacterium]|jgi:pilus assembly protein CpaC